MLSKKQATAIIKSYFGKNPLECHSFYDASQRIDKICLYHDDFSEEIVDNNNKAAVDMESYYFREARYLKRMIDVIDSRNNVLCVVDEILKGTNTHERIAASKAILDYIAKDNCIALIATHDMELTEMLGEKYDNYHFRETVTDKEVLFDYKLHKGPSKTRNAIKLLKAMDFDALKEINNETRGIDRSTDVLSFPMFEKQELDEMIAKKQFEHEDVLGDIIISIARVEEQAKEYGHSFERELSYMVVHGFYHVMGYDHMNEEEKQVMREKEENVLNKLDIKRT